MENSCPKCGGMEIEKDQVRMSGRGLTRFFNIQNRRFDARSCENCGYTELYKKSKSGFLSSILDLFTG
ncbi:MAG: zinc ribbon domain-containing protein [bacterium]